MTLKPIYTSLIFSVLALIGSAGLLSAGVNSLESFGFIASILAIACTKEHHPVPPSTCSVRQTNS